MKDKIKNIAIQIKEEANKLSDNKLRDHFLSHFEGENVQSVKSITSDDIFHIVNNDFVFQIRNNVKFCPIHEVPAKVLLNQKNLKQVFIVNFLENEVVFKEVNK